MAKKDPRVDAYIAKAAPFAKPILRHLRRVIHRGCPGATETMKWGMPAFDCEGPVAHMAAFKAHAVLALWNAEGFTDGARPLGRSTEKAMGQFGRIRSLDDLPAERTLLSLIRRVAARNAAGVRVKRAPKARTNVRAPAFFMEAVRSDAKALAAYNRLSPSHRREYVEWVTEAKTEATRQRRLATAIEWMSEGKRRNWKYDRRP